VKYEKMLPKISANNLTSDSIYLAMRDRIVSGEWEPGMRLVQRALAKEFGSSSIPVLESIRRLESEQLVTSHPNAGAQVRTWSERDIERVYSARAALEGVTCRLFAEQATPSEKAKLVDISRQFDEYYLAGKYKESSQVDIRLHLYIMNRSHLAESSDALSALARNALLLSVTIRSITVKNLANMDNKEEAIPFGGGPVGAHDALIEAFNASDPDTAEKAIQQHINEAKQTLLKAVNLPGFTW
jgi:DNA-binding GntR family transcriptional regulator